jgi:hypothetical protein
MDKIETNTNANLVSTANGVFVRGIVVSNRAKVFNRKDGSGTSVLVEHEIALQPGVVVWARYFDPMKDACVKVEAGVATEYPKLKELAPVAIRAFKLRSDDRTGQLVIKAGELLT